MYKTTDNRDMITFSSLMVGLILFSVGFLANFSISPDTDKWFFGYKDILVYCVYFCIPFILYAAYFSEKDKTEKIDTYQSAFSKKFAAFNKWADENPEEFEKDILRIAKSISDEKKDKEEILLSSCSEGSYSA